MKSDHTPIASEFWGVSLGLQIADYVAPRSEDPKLIIRVISFELTQHIRTYECCRQRQTLNRKEQLRHRAVSLRQHGFFVHYANRTSMQLACVCLNHVNLTYLFTYKSLSVRYFLLSRVIVSLVILCPIWCCVLFFPSKIWKIKFWKACKI